MKIWKKIKDVANRIKNIASGEKFKCPICHLQFYFRGNRETKSDLKETHISMCNIIEERMKEQEFWSF